MTNETVLRRLAAILSADVTGYCRLMGTDEVGTLKIWDVYAKITAELITQYGGRSVGTAGDSVLAEFPSVIECVECSVAIQQELQLKNDKIPHDRRMLFRIGVNLGDVIVQGNEIFGNGVNIAVRLQGLAEPGGICVSNTVYNEVVDKTNLSFEYLGEHAVKNIDKPISVYAIKYPNTGTHSRKQPRKKARNYITKEHILIVEDDADQRRELEEYLTDEGYSVTSSPNVQSARRAMSLEVPDVVITDIRMPGQDGLALIRQIVASNAGIGVIVLSAKDEEIDKVVGLELGADDYLSKPYSPRELLARVHSVLRRRR